MSMIVLCFCLVNFLAYTAAEQVMLLDTTRKDALDWTTYSSSSSRSDSAAAGRRYTRGWREASYTSPESDRVLRVYTVCNIAITARQHPTLPAAAAGDRDADGSLENWLRTPYIEVGPAKLVYVEMEFSMRRCAVYDLLQHSATSQHCRESLKLYYFEAESDFANSQRPTWDSDTYRLIDVIAADHVFTDADDVIINTERRAVSVNGRGLYLAIRDEGTCTTLIALRVFYVACPEVMTSLAGFPRTAAGAQLAAVELVQGSCVDHAVMTSSATPTYLCTSDGSWYMYTGNCQCDAGYHPNDDQTQCQACSVGQYKATVGGDPCRPCPRNSFATQKGSSSCQCVRDYVQRPVTSSTSSSSSSLRSQLQYFECVHAVTSSVRNISVDEVGESMARLSWKRPSDDVIVLYSVQCKQCNDDVRYFPAKSRLNSTTVTLEGLEAGRRYDVNIYVISDVMAASEAQNSAHVAFTTLRDESLCKLQITDHGTNHVTVTWDKMVAAPYMLSFWRADDVINMTSLVVWEPRVTVFGLQPLLDYCFVVRVKSRDVWTRYSDVTCTTTASARGMMTSHDVNVIAGCAAGAIVFLLVIAAILLIYRHLSRCGESQRHVTSQLRHHDGQLRHSRLLQLTATPTPTYIDPDTYDVIGQSPYDVTREIDPDSVTIESVISCGELGNVCKGRLQLLRSRRGQEVNGSGHEVAVKTLRLNADEIARQRFLETAGIMARLNHVNIVYLEGVVSRSFPHMIITEYLHHGPLDIFLRKNSGTVDIQTRVRMMHEISSAMQYFSHSGFVHRDLASHSVLLDSCLVCKLANFTQTRRHGDCQRLQPTDETRDLAVRWAAPEVLSRCQFSSASDVWSFGVVVWELLTFAMTPYWAWSDHDVMRAVQHGFRLPPPANCPAVLVRLMSDCWLHDPTLRPNFSEIVCQMESLLDDKYLLHSNSQEKSVGVQLEGDWSTNMTSSYVSTDDESSKE